ncbi:hypothetical protein MP228_010239 [Amoeboaphelidium protococcarum]|nr:hypothetical protein MP228_010239 [Amoeboaphelidium protococcarum]
MMLSQPQPHSQPRNAMFPHKKLNNRMKEKGRRASISTVSEFGGGGGGFKLSSHNGHSAAYSSTDLKSVPCKFFKSGKCQAGEQCPFSHSLDNWTTVDGVCPFYLKGTCKFGDKCSLPHHLPSSPKTSVPILPSPQSCRDPSAPIEIRKKSLPDIFRWSSEQCSAQSGSISPSSLFYSTAVRDPWFNTNMNTNSPTRMSRLSFAEGKPRSLSQLRESNTCMDQNDEDGGAGLSESDDLTTSQTQFQQQQFSMDESFSMLSIHNANNMNVQSVERSNKLCPFQLHSQCKFGSQCKYIHGLKCELCNKNCLHPTDFNERRKHIVECTKRVRAEKAQMQLNQQIVCQLCGEKIWPDKKFAIMMCEHAFCIPCIRSHRAILLQEGASVPAIQQCPLSDSCDVLTPFVTPSVDWIESKEDRAIVIEQYRAKIAGIPCKYWNFGEDVCPFGKDCYYSHFGSSLANRSSSQLPLYDQVSVKQILDAGLL